MTEQPQATAGDGLPMAAGAPFGAVIVVYRRIEVTPEATRFEYLVLHRAGADPTFEGEWAWTPPSGCRFPGERVKDCARRELEEETGLPLPTIPTAFGNDGWDVFLAQAPPTWKVRLSEEHDRFEWVDADEGEARCQPPLVGAQLRRVADLVEGRAA